MHCQTARPTRKQPQTAGVLSVCPGQHYQHAQLAILQPVLTPRTQCPPSCVQKSCRPHLLVITPQTLLLMISVNVFLLNFLYFTFKLTKAHSLHRSLWTCCPTTAPALTHPPDLPMPSVLCLDAATFLSYKVKGKPFSSTHLEQL